MATKSEAIASFLKARTHDNLSKLYGLEMEVQVNVAKMDGERVDGEFKGRKWTAWTDGIQTWKPFRIPRNAKSDPEYTDTKLNWDLDTYAEGIGMTGWDWLHRRSCWVAFDFDAIVGHSDRHSGKLSDDELQAVRDAASAIPWVEVRYSTSGAGLHLYVHLYPNIETNNHNEHAALARAIIGMMSAETGFDFSSKVDICGGNMWVWHRKMTGRGLKLIKEGEPLREVPSNWRDHLQVISGTRRKTLPSFVVEKQQTDFEELTAQVNRVPLDEKHKILLDYLKDSGALWWWDQDRHMLVTHTFHLSEAFESLDIKGVFKTFSKGTEKGVDQNCFLFPLPKGGWSVRRFSKGVTEEKTWDQDSAGWTRCYFNVIPDIKIAARAFDGVEDSKGNFVFRYAHLAIEAAKLMGIFIEIPIWALGRKATISKHKDGRMIVNFERLGEDNPSELDGWLVEKKSFQLLINQKVESVSEPQAANHDDFIRHLVDENNENFGWIIKTDEEWRFEPLTHVKDVLSSLSYDAKEIKAIIGSCIVKCWKMVNIPFADTYPGDRQWNKGAAKLKYSLLSEQDDLKYPTWLKILNHCGSNLTVGVLENKWCQENNIVTGADYLKCWVASMFQFPSQPLPYLFFYGPQNSGKSIFHEALNLLFENGYVRADSALINNFNAELANAILCVVEETNLRVQKSAAERIKDWVTSPQLPIHGKNKTPYLTQNTTHWIQCSNDHTFCPVFPGDTRIVISHVGPLTEVIPKRKLIEQLQKEARDFTTEMLTLELPESNDRLNIPVVETHDKKIIQDLNRNPLEEFLDTECYYVEGEQIRYGEFYEKFTEWLDPSLRSEWSKIRVGKSLPFKFPKGRDGSAI